MAGAETGHTARSRKPTMRTLKFVLAFLLTGAALGAIATALVDMGIIR